MEEGYPLSGSRGRGRSVWRYCSSCHREVHSANWARHTRSQSHTGHSVRQRQRLDNATEAPPVLMRDRSQESSDHVSRESSSRRSSSSRSIDVFSRQGELPYDLCLGEGMSMNADFWRGMSCAAVTFSSGMSSFVDYFRFTGEHFPDVPTGVRQGIAISASLYASFVRCNASVPDECPRSPRDSSVHRWGEADGPCDVASVGPPAEPVPPPLAFADDGSGMAPEPSATYITERSGTGEISQNFNLVPETPNMFTSATTNPPLAEPGTNDGSIPSDLLSPQERVDPTAGSGLALGTILDDLSSLNASFSLGEDDPAGTPLAISRTDLRSEPHGDIPTSPVNNGPIQPTSSTLVTNDKSAAPLPTHGKTRRPRCSDKGKENRQQRIVPSLSSGRSNCEERVDVAKNRAGDSQPPLKKSRVEVTIPQGDQSDGLARIWSRRQDLALAEGARVEALAASSRVRTLDGQRSEERAATPELPSLDQRIAEILGEPVKAIDSTHVHPSNSLSKAQSASNPVARAVPSLMDVVVTAPNTSKRLPPPPLPRRGASCTVVSSSRTRTSGSGLVRPDRPLIRTFLPRTTNAVVRLPLFPDCHVVPRNATPATTPSISKQAAVTQLLAQLMNAMNQLPQTQTDMEPGEEPTMKK